MEQSLAPQMLMSLNILQVPILDLQEMVRAEMDQNPTLEREAPEIEQPAELDDFDSGDWNSDLTPAAPDANERYQYMMDSIAGETTLQNHLLEQLTLAGLDEQERAVAEILIGNIDDDGYLCLDTGAAETSDLFDRVLKTIQGFDPVGVGARDLKECLLLQLQNQKKENSLEAELVRNHLEQLGAHQYEQIAHDMKLTLDEIRTLAATVAALDPKPGRNFSAAGAEYIIPEITIQKKNGIWTVTQNRAPYPRLFISQKYLELLDNETTLAETKKYIRAKIAKSRFFIRCIDQRQQTIYRIACEIADIQHDYLEQGISALKPMTMKQIADRLHIHESTVGRACSGKYIATPHGTVELKTLFTSGIALADGTQISNAAIKNEIASIIRSESRRHPFTDQHIVDELRKKNIHIARRTVAKYRDNLNLLPARLRRGI